MTGSDYVGWQRQENGPSVQEALENAIVGLTGQHCPVTVAGRTDAGVHALAQVCHFDAPKTYSEFAVTQALNHHLRPHRIAVLEAEAVDEGFHARFSAVERAYLYRILNRRARPALDHLRVWHVPLPLDVEAMHEAAQVLVGHHDFTSFRATMCQAKSPVKTLDELRVVRAGDEIHIHTRARSFLHNQVRIMVGTLQLVGRGKWTVRDVEAALSACDRRAAGPTAPPEGLYLAEVRYETGSGDHGCHTAEYQAEDEAEEDKTGGVQAGGVEAGAGDEPLIDDHGDQHPHQ